MKRIATKLIAWFLLISVVPLALVAILAQKNAELNLRSEIENHLRATADSKAQQIHAFFREKESQIIARLLDGPPAVLSTGGGAYLSENNRQMISKRGVAV